MGAEIKVKCSATLVRYTLYIIITRMMQQFVDELIEWSRQLLSDEYEQVQIKWDANRSDPQGGGHRCRWTVP